MEDFMILTLKREFLIKLVLSLILSLMLMMSCDNNPLKPIEPQMPPSQSGDFVQGELYIQCNSINDILKIYSKYELKIESTWVSRGYTISFNYKLTNHEELIERLSKDKRVFYVEMQPAWKKGDMIADVYGLNDNDAINRFLQSFSDWDLKLISNVKLKDNYIVRFSYNPLKNEFALRREMKNHELTNMVDFNGSQRQWESGKILIIPIDNGMENLVKSYPQFDINILSKELLLVTFDYDQVDEFELLNTFLNDPDVYSAGFNTNIHFRR